MMRIICDGPCIDWQTASTADYEKALRGLLERQDEFWEWWRGSDESNG